MRRRTYLEPPGRKCETEEQPEALSLHRRVGGWLEPQVDPVSVTGLEFDLLLESELPGIDFKADEHGCTLLPLERRDEGPQGKPRHRQRIVQGLAQRRR